MPLPKRHNLTNMLHRLPRGGPMDTATLRKYGVSSQLAYHYTRTGWLKKLARGVFMFPNDNLKLSDTLNFLTRKIDGLHVGGKTALAWRGIYHNLSENEPLWLLGNRKAKLPKWFTDRFPAYYSSRSPFHPKAKNAALKPLPEAVNGPPVSEPERAFLEVLGEVGIHSGMEEAGHLAEALTRARSEVFVQLLKNCKKEKINRLFLHFLYENKVPWAEQVKKSTNLKNKRWVQRLKDGSLLTLKPNG